MRTTKRRNAKIRKKPFSIEKESKDSMNFKPFLKEIDSKDSSFNEPDEFKNVISPDSGDLSSLQYFGAIILAFTLASVVIFYVLRWRAQR